LKGGVVLEWLSFDEGPHQKVKRGSLRQFRKGYLTELVHKCTLVV